MKEKNKVHNWRNNVINKILPSDQYFEKQLKRGLRTHMANFIVWQS